MSRLFMVWQKKSPAARRGGSSMNPDATIFVSGAYLLNLSGNCFMIPMVSMSANFNMCT